MAIYAMIAVVVFVNAIIIPRGEGQRGLDLQNDKKCTLRCKPAKGPFEKVPGLKDWCNRNCHVVPKFCPSINCGRTIYIPLCNCM
jgi:hypothetical protein